MAATKHRKPAIPSKGSSTAEPGPRRPSAQPRTRAEQYAAGKALREACPRETHAVWKPPAGRRDAVETVLAAEKGRMPELLPLRHGRMVRSPFTFYRGSALAMAADLGATPSSGRLRPVLRGRAPEQFRRVRHPGAADHLLHQRPRRDAARAMGVGSQAPRDEFRRGVPGQRAERVGGQGRGQDLRALLPRGHRRVQPVENAGAVVPGHVAGRAGAGRQGSRLPQARPRAHAEGTGEEHRRGHLPEAGGAQGRDPGHQGSAPHHLPPRGRSARRHPAGAAGRAGRVPFLAALGVSGAAGPLRASGRRHQGGGGRQRRDQVLGVSLHGGR